MKLYYTPGACSMAPHIVLREASFIFALEQVDLVKKRTAAGQDYYQINPKGYVPALRLDNGQILTEVAVILQYLADRKPEAGLAPEPGSMERYRMMEWLNYLATEVHKQIGPLFNPQIPAEWRENQLAVLDRRFELVAEALKDKQYILGEKFTVADAYLYTLLTWTRFLKIDLGKWPALKDYVARVAARPTIREVMKAEGLTR